MVWIVLGVGSVVGLLIGLGALRLHLATDPLADVHAYYDAGARLNAGLPLYTQTATTNDPGFYRYPPLLAILFRPLALLPFAAAAATWMIVLGLATLLTLWRLSRGLPLLLATGMLAMPILWTLAIGQAQVLVTLLLAYGTPFGVALAGHLKLTPWLVAVYWVGRRDLAAVRWMLVWVLVIGLVQLALAPQATIDYLTFPSLTQVGDVVNLSPYAVSPLLWVVVVLLGTLLALRLAPTRWGWAAAVALGVGATPRLLGYQLSSLMAAFGGPDDHPRRREGGS